jgi:hypothetical protein
MSELKHIFEYYGIIDDDAVSGIDEMERSVL